MTLPAFLQNSKPADTDSPSQGAASMRTITAWLQDLFGIPDSTNITGPIMTLASTNDGRVASDTIVKGLNPVKRLIGIEANGRDIQLVETGGLIQFQRNDGTEQFPVWSVLWQINAVTGESTNAALLTNRTGVTLAVGDVVTFDPGNDNSVILDDTQASTRPFVISLDVPTVVTQGRFQSTAIQAVVNVTGAVSRGHYIWKSATTRVAEDTGVAVVSNQSPPRGSIGIALTGSVSGRVTALLFGETVGSRDDPQLATFTNKTGSTTVAGDVVALDVNNDVAVTLSDVQSSVKQFVVDYDGSVLSNASGRYVTMGKHTPVSVAGAVTRGHYLRKSTAPRVLEDTGVLMDGVTAPPIGSVGIALTSTSPGVTFVTAYLFGGTVAYPTSPVILAKSGTDVTLTNTTTETTMISLPVAGGTLGTSGSLRVATRWKVSGDGGTGAGVTFGITFKFNYGGTTILTTSFSVVADNGAGSISAFQNAPWEIEWILSAHGATNSQLGWQLPNPLNTLAAVISGTATQGNFWNLNSTANIPRGTAAVDSTVSQTLAITAQWGHIGAANVLVLEHYDIVST